MEAMVRTVQKPVIVKMVEVVIIYQEHAIARQDGEDQCKQTSKFKRNKNHHLRQPAKFLNSFDVKYFLFCLYIIPLTSRECQLYLMQCLINLQPVLINALFFQKNVFRAKALTA